jgi:hypothetical protein
MTLLKTTTFIPNKSRTREETKTPEVEEILTTSSSKLLALSTFPRG